MATLEDVYNLLPHDEKQRFEKLSSCLTFKLEDCKYLTEDEIISLITPMILREQEKQYHQSLARLFLRKHCQQYNSATCTKCGKDLFSPKKREREMDEPSQEQTNETLYPDALNLEHQVCTSAHRLVSPAKEPIASTFFNLNQQNIYTEGWLTKCQKLLIPRCGIYLWDFPVIMNIIFLMRNDEHPNPDPLYVNLRRNNLKCKDEEYKRLFSNVMAKINAIQDGNIFIDIRDNELADTMDSAFLQLLYEKRALKGLVFCGLDSDLIPQDHPHRTEIQNIIDETHRAFYEKHCEFMK